jgi:hypothetical protein
LLSQVEILHIAGPKSREFAAKVAPGAENIGFLGMAPLVVGGVDAKVFRVSFSGLQGYGNLDVFCHPTRVFFHPTSSQNPMASAFNSFRLFLFHVVLCCVVSYRVVVRVSRGIS